MLFPSPSGSGIEGEGELSIAAARSLPFAPLLGLLRGLHSFITWIEGHGAAAPWLFLGLFLAASALMIWRLEAMSDDGMEGTVLGTLVMPYCSGIGNLVFAFVLGRNHGPGPEVMTNALVNNVTNMTLLIGLPTLFWGMRVTPPVKAGKSKSGSAKKIQVHKINRLSLLLTLTAVLFFTGAVWALARDGSINFNDGLVLVGLFLFWQCFHVFDVLKSNVRENKSFSWMLPVDLGLLAIGAVAVYVSTDWLVSWVSRQDYQIINKNYLGWLSGWLMVLPNAMLALYYGWCGRPEVVYSSQVGDGHVCIPLCVGIYALFNPLKLPDFFETGILVLAGATVFHAVVVAVFGRLPRVMGVVLIAAYAVFLWKGLPK